jgi:hypothetical protein
VPQRDRWFLLAIAAVTAAQAALFAYYLQATLVVRPYSDMFVHVSQYLRYQQDGELWASWWARHGQHHQVWMRALTWFDAKAFSGIGYPFVVAATACQVLTALLLVREVRVAHLPDLQRIGRCVVIVLLFTSVSAVVCATLTNGVYPQTVVFVVLALVLFEGTADHEVSGRAVHWKRAAALGSAMAAAMANAVALVLWPILLWASWRTRAGRGWTIAVFVIGAAFTAFYLSDLSRLPMQTAAALAAAGENHALRQAAYLFAYLGLPWSRAAVTAPLGNVLGGLILVTSLVAIVRVGLVRAAISRRERIGIGMILFGLGSAMLAAFGRAYVDVELIVPVRYTTYVALLHVGLMFLALPYLERRWQASVWRRWSMAAVIACGCLMLVQQVVAGQTATARARSINAAIQRFADGQATPDMVPIVSNDLAFARAVADAMARAGIYQSAVE